MILILGGVAGTGGLLVGCLMRLLVAHLRSYPPGSKAVGAATIPRWRFVGTGPYLCGPLRDSENITINGVNPWRYQWKTLRWGVPIILQNPITPSRKHWLKVFEFEAENSRITFAGGEMAERRFGFYVPAEADEAGTFAAQEPQYAGYWRASRDEESELPWPNPDSSWTGREEFLKTLDIVEAHAERIAYRGLSICRICKCRNGHEGLRLAGWEWPAGYRHYMADHEVRPSSVFEDFIRTLHAEFEVRV